MYLNIKERTTFGRIADLYDKSRTSYSPELIMAILNFSKLDLQGNILDIGCGSGQASFLFAEKGFNVLGLDLSLDLINIAKEKSSSLKKVEFMHGSFENEEFQEKSFDLIISGMAWHWIEAENRYLKIYKTLKENGTVAFFWSCQKTNDLNFINEMSNILDVYGGKNAGPAGSRVKELANKTYKELQDSKLFSNLEIKEYEDILDFSKERYSNLVLSYAWAQQLSLERQQEMLQNLEDAYKKYQKPLMIPYNYILILAKKNKV
ncbi:methyltransferase domain-containing protein [Candidatus Woesearchaeota archaeon]|nr:methyltransferase domain-containing protein [Candidatus Woesearchaeota archaeon]